MEQSTIKHCVSVPEAAKAAGVSSWLAWKHVRLKRLHVRKIGRRTIVRPEDFAAWVDGRGDVTSTNEKAAAEIAA
jgi:hypothetical protein